MKKFFSFAVASFTALALNAQNLPQPSPKAKVFQTVGLTDIEVEYSSPAVNNRSIWGDVVPYDELWRTGANRATKITFSTDVDFAGNSVKAGTYAIFTIPGKERIAVVLNSNFNQGGTDGYDPALNVAKADVSFDVSPNVTERMRFTIEDATDNSANLVMTWEKRRFSVPVKVNTEEFAERSIQEKIKEIEGLYSFYNNAASYYLRAGKNPNQALEWAKKSVDISAKFWNTHTLAKAYNAAGDKKMAMETARRSLAMSKEAKYDSYVKMNEDLIRELGGKI